MPRRARAPTTRCRATAEPYFLRAGEGPRHVLFGQVAFQLMTGAESGGRLGMTVTEGPRGPAIPTHVHAAHATRRSTASTGRLRVTVDGEEHLLTRGDFVSIPAGAEHTLRDGCAPDTVREHVRPGRASSASTRWPGDVAEQRIFPEQPGPVDRDRLSAAAAELDIVFVG